MERIRARRNFIPILETVVIAIGIGPDGVFCIKTSIAGYLDRVAGIFRIRTIFFEFRDIIDAIPIIITIEND